MTPPLANEGEELEMAETPRKLRIIAGLVLPLTTGGLAGAQEVGKQPAVPPAFLPPASEAVAPRIGVEPEVQATPPLQANLESSPARQSSWWHRFKCRLHACVLGYPEEFEPTPLGASVYAFGRAQVANAEAAQMVLYQADFFEGTGQLSLRGRDQLAKIAVLLSKNFSPLVIERSPHAPELDQLRQAVVLNELSQGGFAIPPERVVVGQPLAFGIGGTQAGLIYTNLLGQTLSGGARSAGGGAPGVGGGPAGPGGAPR